MKSFKQLLEDIQVGPAPEEISYKGYTTKNLHHVPDAAKAFQATITRVQKGTLQDNGEVLAALKATDTYMKLNDMHLEQEKDLDSQELDQWLASHEEAKSALTKIGEFEHHYDYWNSHNAELQYLKANQNMPQETESVKVDEASKLQGTPVVSLSDFGSKDNTKNKYGQTVPKKLKPNDPRVKMYTEPKKEGVAEGLHSDYVFHRVQSGYWGSTHLDKKVVVKAASKDEAHAKIRQRKDFVKKLRNGDTVSWRLAEGLADDFLAMAKNRNPNARIVTAVQKRKEAEELMKKREASGTKPAHAANTSNPRPLGGHDPKSGRSYSESVESIDEISTELKQKYLAAATKKHLQQFLGREKVRDKQELDKRRAAIQKTSKELTGKTHYQESVELDESLKTHYQNGYDAQKKGKTRQDNPHREGTPAASMWAKGWEHSSDKRAPQKFANEQVELDEAVSVEHDRYMRSHGKKASGSGNWMFTHKRAGDVDYKNEKEVHQTRGSFADAAKSAKNWAKSHGHSTVYVMEQVELEEVMEGQLRNFSPHSDLAGRGRLSGYNKTATGKKREYDRETERLKDKMKFTKSQGGIAGPKGKLPEQVELDEKTLTPAELKKREEVAKAMERKNPNMDMSRKMAIATAVAKRVAEQYDDAE